VKCVLTTLSAFVPRFLQPFTALPEGRALKALRSQISSSGTPRGPPSLFLSVDGGRSWITSSSNSRGARRQCFLALMVGVPGSPAPAPPEGPPSTSSASVVAAAGPADNTPRGPTIHVFNFGGGHYWTCRQHPPGSLPSTSSTSVVVTVRPAASTLRGPTVDFS
jgi:hypothetical protein